MGLLLVVLGIVLWLLVSPTLGLILVVLGVILFFIPWDAGYGYSRWRRPPP